MSEKDDTYDPLYIGTLEDLQSKTAPEEVAPEEVTAERVRKFLNKRMNDRGLQRLMVYIEDVIEDYYLILSELHEETIEMGDPRVSVFAVFTEIVLNPTTEEEWGIREYVRGRELEVSDNNEDGAVSGSFTDTLDRMSRKRLARLYAVVAQLCTVLALSFPETIDGAEQDTCGSNAAIGPRKALLDDVELALKRATEIVDSLDSPKEPCSKERRFQINVENARQRLSGYREGVVALIEAVVTSHSQNHLASRVIMEAIASQARKLASTFGVKRPSEEALLKQVQRWRSDTA